MPSATLLAALLLLVPVAVVVAVTGRRALLAALPFLVAINGVPIVAGGYAIRVDQVAALLLTLSLGLACLFGHRTLYVDRPMKWLLAFGALNLLSSVLFSPARSYSVVQVANIASAWLVYVVTVNYADDEDAVRRMTRRWLIAGLVASAVGVLAFVLARAGLDLGGANIVEAVGDAVQPVGSYGTMREPNIYGSYCAAMLVAGLGLLLLRAERRETLDRLGVRVFVASTGLGLLMSFTRGAWLGAASGMALLLYLAARRFGVRIKPSRILGPLALLLVVCVVLWFSPFEAAEFFRYKVRNLLNTRSTNAVVRLLAFALALEQTARRPILGWGTYSFAPLLAEGSNFRELGNWQNLWIPNFVLQVLHDTGVVGLVVFLSLLTSIVRMGLAAARRLRQRAPADAATALSLTVAFCTLFVPFLFTTGFSLGYAWILPGLVGAHARLAAKREEAEAETVTAEGPAVDDPGPLVGAG